MQDEASRTQTGPPPTSSSSKLLGIVLGRRRTLVVDARYQFRVAAAAAGSMLFGVALFAGAIHHETTRLHEIVARHDADIARALGDASPIGLAAIAAAGVVLAFGALVVALVETHRVAGPALSLTRTLNRLEDGHYTTPARLRAGDRLVVLSTALNALGKALTRRATSDAELFESVAARVETAKGEEELEALAAELRDRAREKRLHLGQ